MRWLWLLLLLLWRAPGQLPAPSLVAPSPTDVASLSAVAVDTAPIAATPFGDNDRDDDDDDDDDEEADDEK